MMISTATAFQIRTRESPSPSLFRLVVSRLIVYRTLDVLFCVVVLFLKGGGGITRNGRPCARAAAEAIYKATGSPEDNAKLRFVVMFCDPVARLESAYVFFRGRCEAALDCQPDGPYKHRDYAGWVDELLQKYPADIRAAGGDPGKLQGSLYHQVTSSLYAAHLGEWTRHFDPAQFLVIPSYYYYADPQRALHDVAAHVGSKVDATVGEAKHANNYPEKERLIGHVSDAHRKGVEDIFEPQLVKLRETMCDLRNKGLKIGSWDDVEDRKRYWSFMPEAALKDC